MAEAHLGLVQVSQVLAEIPLAADGSTALDWAERFVTAATVEEIFNGTGH